MNVSDRIIINSAALYLKMGVVIFVTLLSTRVLLDVLGIADFGIYNLIAGVVALLAFINSAMMVATQRYLSISIGRNDINHTRKIFNSSIVLHMITALVVVVILEILSLFIFNGFLKIDAERIPAAKVVYQMMVGTTFITLVGIPYNAVINAREEMWFFALVEAVINILKLTAAYLLYLINYDALILYAIAVFFITIINFVIKLWWGKKRYAECRGSLHENTNRSILRDISGFFGWNTLSAAVQIGRTQGSAVILNYFWGVTANAAYGVTNQINAFQSNFSQTMTMAIAPQITISKGMGDNERMLRLSVLASKMSFFISSIVSIILLAELPYILDVWLKEIPQYTLDFCKYTIWTFMIMQLYPGLVRALQADGRIRNYQITIFLIITFSLCASILAYAYGSAINSIFLILLIAQILIMCSTVYYCHKYAGLSIMNYFINVILKPVVLMVAVLFAAKLFRVIDHDLIRLVAVSIFVALTITSLFYFVILDSREKKQVKSACISIVRKLK